MKYLFVLVFFTLISCSEKTEKLREFNWLVGKWETTAHGKTMIEEWKRTNDSTLSGTSYLVRPADTFLQERMTITSVNSSVSFKTVVSNQNDQKEIAFKLTELTDKEAHFENPEHDFPQRIVYTHPTPDSLSAYVDGKSNGKYIKVDFKLSRAKDHVHP